MIINSKILELMEFIKFRMNLKKKCNRIKNLKLVEDIDKEDENELRNQNSKIF